MLTKTESIKAFLTASTHADLAALYTPDMECQVNVAADGGTRIEGEYMGRGWQGWTDGLQTWKSFRIPVNANTVPEYKDGKMAFSLEQHAEGIGMTGWDWKNLLSRWVAFDFDAFTGHSARHAKKLTPEEITAVQDAVNGIPWVTIRKSAGGKGLHLYVFLEPVQTKNHNEHAALARAILGKMAAITGHDLEARVDICGQNMWVWHRKMKGTDGLALVRSGGTLNVESLVPNWRDHVQVITGHRRKSLPKFISDVSESGSTEAERWFLELTGQSTRTPLDDEHKRLIKWLDDHGTQSWWDIDHHMLVTHTFHLKEAHEALKLRGIFETLSQGTEAGHDHNAYLFPLRRGGWAVRRYSMGVAEAPSWDQDGRGWTRCYYNVDPDLGSAARALGGLEDPSGGYEFNEADIARDAATALGAVIPELPPGIKPQKARLKPHKDGRVVMEIEGDKTAIAAHEMKGWLHKKGKWTRIFNVANLAPAETEVPMNDDFVRHIVTNTGEDFGWVIRGENETWRMEPLTHVQKALEATGVNPKDVKMIIGSSVIKCWTLVNRPFQPEYPGDRLWNRNAAQFRYIPSQNEELKYPHWLKILNHIGAGLDVAIKDSAWAKMNGILTGADYLKVWIASLFKEPLEPLPYLFFYGSQNCGKSIFHEAISRLITKGYIRADNALVNQQGFNEELANAIICVVEEINLKRDKNALNRIKDWVTARDLPIHPKGRTVYHVPNSTHWVQAANDPNFCPVFPGDTRITMIHVPDIDPVEMIPKKRMLEALDAEAADFLGEILRLEIPPSNDRLNVPVIVTAEKAESERANRTPLQQFLAEKVHYVPGEMIKLSELYDAFIEYADPTDVINFSKQRFGRELPVHFPKGRSRSDGQHYVGNVSFEPQNGHQPKPALRVSAPDKNNFVFLDPENGNNT